MSHFYRWSCPSCPPAAISRPAPFAVPPQRKNPMTTDRIQEKKNADRAKMGYGFAVEIVPLALTDPKRIKLATDLDRLATAQLAELPRTDPKRRWWFFIKDIADGTSNVLPEPPTPLKDDRTVTAPDLPGSPSRAFGGLLHAFEVEELKPLAAGVSKAVAEDALNCLELEEADPTATLKFGLTEQEVAAARLLRDDRDYKTALAETSAEVKAFGERLAALTKTTNTNEPDGPTVALFHY